MTKVRPVRVSAPWFVEMVREVRGAAVGAGGKITASKLVISWGLPSSKTVKDALVRFSMGTFFLSVTTASTVTSST